MQLINKHKYIERFIDDTNNISCHWCNKRDNDVQLYQTYSPYSLIFGFHKKCKKEYDEQIQNMKEIKIR